MKTGWQILMTLICFASIPLNIWQMFHPAPARAQYVPTVSIPVYGVTEVVSKSTTVAFVADNATAEQVALAVLSGRANLETHHLYLRDYQSLGFDLTTFDRWGRFEYPSADSVREKAEKILLNKIGVKGDGGR